MNDRGEQYKKRAEELSVGGGIGGVAGWKTNGGRGREREKKTQRTR